MARTKVSAERVGNPGSWLPWGLNTSIGLNGSSFSSDTIIVTDMESYLCHFIIPSLTFTPMLLMSLLVRKCLLDTA